jgi:DNA-binding NtrC family response regulator
LILEDFDGIRALLSSHFKRQGYDVESAATLRGALALAVEDRPNVLFVDYDLSAENPYTTIQVLHAALPESTIVLMGGPITTSDQERAHQAGANRIMEKGYDLTAMDEIVTQANTHSAFATAA